MPINWVVVEEAPVAVPVAVWMDGVAEGVVIVAFPVYVGVAEVMLPKVEVAWPQRVKVELASVAEGVDILLEKGRESLFSLETPRKPIIDRQNIPKEL